MTTPVLPRLRPVPDSPDRALRPLLIVVGGVPGAGKSTVLARVADDVRGALVLDPDGYRRRVSAVVPSWVPYGAYRGAVHALHAVATVVSVLRGPRAGVRAVLVHDTATRERRRQALGVLARLGGWDPALVIVDVSLADALDGQLDRGRVVRPDEFVRHWERWTSQRSLLAASAGAARGPWSSVRVTSRRDAFGHLRGLVRLRVAQSGTVDDEPVQVLARGVGVPCVA